MCGRFTITGEVPEIEHRFSARVKLKPLDFKPHYNFAPSMELPIVLPAQEDGETNERELVLGKWGFKPPWMKNFKPQANARLETVAEKRMFRDAFKKRHCLIPANNFFEWH